MDVVRVLLVLVPLAVPLAVAVVLGVAVQRIHDVAERVAILRWVGFGVVAAFVGFVALFLVGETFLDPGGWDAVALVAAWLVPLVMLSLLGFLRPGVAIPVLAVAALVPMGFGVWAMADFQGLRDWEDGVGPVGLVVTLVVGAALAVTGLSRTHDAGWLMVIVTVAPLALSMVGAGREWGLALSLGLITAPILACGVLYLWAAHLEGTSAAPSRGEPLASRH